ncbi:MAG: GcrA family cell cycle regulator [Mesorhizobium sp.]
MQWSDERRQEVLKAYYGEGLSAQQVAGRYGVTRQAIIGLVHRYSAKYGFQRKGQAAAAPRRERASSPRVAMAWAPPRPAVPSRLPQPAPVALPSLSLPFDALGTTRCQFATTPHHVAAADHRFCGHPVETGRWCAHHARLIRHPKHREDNHD